MAAARVLVIDDSPTIVRVVQLVLTKAGFAIEAAADGEAGLAAARATRPVSLSRYLPTVCWTTAVMASGENGLVM